MRPLSQGHDAIASDLVALHRCLRRVQTDPKRPEGEKQKLVKALREVITTLLNSDRDALKR